MSEEAQKATEGATAPSRRPWGSVDAETRGDWIPYGRSLLPIPDDDADGRFIHGYLESKQANALEISHRGPLARAGRMRNGGHYLPRELDGRSITRDEYESLTL